MVQWGKRACSACGQPRIEPQHPMWSPKPAGSDLKCRAWSKPKHQGVKQKQTPQQRRRLSPQYRGPELRVSAAPAPRLLWKRLTEGAAHDAPNAVSAWNPPSVHAQGTRQQTENQHPQVHAPWQGSACQHLRALEGKSRSRAQLRGSSTGTRSGWRSPPYSPVAPSACRGPT